MLTVSDIRIGSITISDPIGTSKGSFNGEYAIIGSSGQVIATQRFADHEYAEKKVKMSPYTLETLDRLRGLIREDIASSIGLDLPIPAMSPQRASQPVASPVDEIPF